MSFGKFHYSDKTQKIGRCKAVKGNCPFTDVSDSQGGHFDTFEEAEKYLENKLEKSTEGSYSSISSENTSMSWSTVKKYTDELKKIPVQKIEPVEIDFYLARDLKVQNHKVDTMIDFAKVVETLDLYEETPPAYHYHFPVYVAPQGYSTDQEPTLNDFLDELEIKGSVEQEKLQSIRELIHSLN